MQIQYRRKASQVVGRASSGPCVVAVRPRRRSGDAEMRRYSPAECIGADMKVVSSDPDPKHVSTSYVERHNPTMRMEVRRFTRLMNGFSKKFENHAAMVAIHSVYYNFACIHKTLPHSQHGCWHERSRLES